MRELIARVVDMRWLLPFAFLAGLFMPVAVRFGLVFDSFALLVVVAVISVTLLIRRPSPLLFMAAALAAFGTVGDRLWEWGRHGPYRWSGLPLTYGLSGHETAATRLLFLSSATTCLAGALLLPRRTQVSVSVKTLDWQRLSQAAIPLNISALVCYLVGQGTSVIQRDVYLQSNGVNWLLRVAVGLLIPIVTANFLLLLAPLPRNRRHSVIALQVVWAIVLASTGTRIAIISLLLLAVALLISSRGAGRLLGTAAATAATIASMTWVHEARESRQGLRPLLDDLLSGRLLATLDPHSVGNAFQGMAASIGAAYPITAMSAERPAPLSAIWTLANPFPRDLLSSGSVDVVTHDYGMLTPLTWVPRSTIGMVASAGSWPLLVLTWAVTAVAIWLADRWLLRLPYGQMASYGFALLVFFSSLQYGIRQQMRVLTIALAIGAVSAFLHNRKTREQDRQHGHPSIQVTDIAIDNQARRQMAT
jgi:hypothetical protein